MGFSAMPGEGSIEWFFFLFVYVFVCFFTCLLWFDDLQRELKGSSNEAPFPYSMKACESFRVLPWKVQGRKSTCKGRRYSGEPGAAQIVCAREICQNVSRIKCRNWKHRKLFSKHRCCLDIPNKTAAKLNAKVFFLLPPTWFRLKVQTVEEHHINAKHNGFWFIGDMYRNTHELNQEELHTVNKTQPACCPVYVQRWPLRFCF